MNQLSLADLVVQQEPLAPREAVTLTLAVAREWDRQRALRGPVALPEIGAIALRSGGEISFLVMPPASGTSDAAALAALLGKLLGIDGADTVRRPIPGGLLIIMAGRLGQTELPSATTKGFCAALARFADDDPALLSGIFWRAATRSRFAATRRRGDGRDHFVPERRCQPPAISVLRREIRALEQRVFESQHQLTPTTERRARTTYRRPKVMASVAAACTVLILALGLMMIEVRPPVAVRTLAEPPAVGNRLASAADSEITGRVGRVLSDPPLITPPRSTPADAESRTRVIRSKPRTAARQRSGPPSTQAPHAPRKSRPAALFPGGTRTIAWLGSSR
jgi:hypothetical protein